MNDLFSSASLGTEVYRVLKPPAVIDRTVQPSSLQIRSEGAPRNLRHETASIECPRDIRHMKIHAFRFWRMGSSRTLCGSQIYTA